MILPTKEEFRAALAKTERLIPAPRTLSRALQLLRNPDSGLSEIADLIRCDSALAVDMLRCANSAFYSRPERITDVSDAVQLIETVGQHLGLARRGPVPAELAAGRRHDELARPSF